jgi:FAD/FMN-containing dehydrogenase
MHYTKLANHHIASFRSLLGSHHVIHGSPEQLSAFNVDWMKKYKGQSELVLFPQTSHELSCILKYCHQEHLPVVPQGGNTGLVGGGVPVFDEIIISTAKMNRILDFDSVSGVVTLESGVILEQLDQWLKERGHICPLDLGAKGSCHVGGNLATNAGGLRLLRYGSLHGNVLGLEAVLPDGTILDSLSTLRKDNTGLDLKQLFIGSEGSLGIISKITLLAPQKPNSVQTAILQLKSYQDVKKVFVECRKRLNEILSAFEFWDSASDQLIRKHIQHARHPFHSSCPFTVLIETQGSHVEHDQEKIMGFLEEMMDKDLIVDGTLAQDETQTQHIWAMREGIPEACAREGAVYKYDIR